MASYTWTKDNLTVSTHGDTAIDDAGSSKSGEGSTLIIYDGSIESYTCVTSNMMGVATCKLEAHQIQGMNYPLILPLFYSLPFYPHPSLSLSLSLSLPRVLV